MPRPLAATALAALALLTALEAHGAQAVPLPRPRPPGLGGATTVPLPPLRPAILPEPAKPSPPSACQLRLPDIATIEIVPPVLGPGACGIADAVMLSAIKTQSGWSVAVAPPATLRCETAEAIANWLREDVAPIASALGAPLASIQNFASYECRGRNRVVGAMISEHGKGNALDIRSFTLADGRTYEPTDIAMKKETREQLKASACARFSTVLGPASDGYHENHIHVDVAQRRSGYRICQWAVRDASATIPLPRDRPAEAPR